jgi:PEP-CTERM motif
MKPIKHRKTSLTLAATIAVSILLGTTSAQATTYDPVVDFSFVSNSNVNGVWSYGQSTTLGGAFSLLTTPVNDSLNPLLEDWQGTVTGFSGNYPVIQHNPTGISQAYGGTATSEPDELLFHPGPGGEYSVLRFVVPATGSYNLAGAFTGRDIGPSTTDVSVLLNMGVGTPLFAGDTNIVGGNVASFNVTQSFTAGDTIDFAVGYGNGSYVNDSTGLKLSVISAATAPEPTTLALIGLGSGIGMLVRCRNVRRA